MRLLASFKWLWLVHLCMGWSVCVYGDNEVARLESFPDEVQSIEVPCVKHFEGGMCKTAVQIHRFRFTQINAQQMQVAYGVTLQAAKRVSIHLYMDTHDHGDKLSDWSRVEPFDQGHWVSASDISAVVKIPNGASCVTFRLAIYVDDHKEPFLTPARFVMMPMGLERLLTGLNCCLPLDGSVYDLSTKHIATDSVDGFVYVPHEGFASAWRLHGREKLQVSVPESVAEGSFSFAMWIKGDYQPKGVVTGTRPMDALDEIGFTMQAQSTFLKWKTPNGPAESLAVPVYDDRWVHIIVVFDRKANRVRAYMNGRLVAMRHFYDPEVESPDFRFVEDKNDLVLGADALGGHAFKGMLDEVLRWDRALSENEVEMLYRVNRGSLKRYMYSMLVPHAHPVLTNDHFQLRAMMHWYDGQPVTCGVLYGSKDAGENVFAWEYKKEFSLDQIGVQELALDLPFRDEPIRYARWFCYDKARDVATFSEPIELVQLNLFKSIYDDLELYLPLSHHVYNFAPGSQSQVAPVAHDGAIPQEVYTRAPGNLMTAAAFSRDTWFINAGRPEFMAHGCFSLGLWLQAEIPERRGGGYLGSQNWITRYNPGWALAAWNGELYYNLTTQRRNPYSDKALTGEWAYYGFTINRDVRRVSIYKNGALLNRFEGDQVDNLLRHSLLTEDFALGAIGGSAKRFQLPSLQAEIALWSRELSEQEMSMVYRGLHGVLANGLDAITFDFQDLINRPDATAYHGLYPCRGAFINVLTKPKKDSVSNWIDNHGRVVEGMTISYTGRAVKAQSLAKEGYDSLLVGQLLDVGSATQPPISIALTKVPYARYSVIFYKGSSVNDAQQGWNRFAPIFLNGRWYRPNKKGVAVPCGFDDLWGDSFILEPRLGANAILFEGLSGDVTFLMPRNNPKAGRANVAAFQIISEDPPATDHGPYILE